jgi:hypothetical protein
MTFERKIVVGLEEIKAVIFQCNKCGSRMSIAPDKFDDIPGQCPNGHPMLTAKFLPQDFGGSLMFGFLQALKKLKEPIYESAGFKIFLEFEEPKL